MAELLLKLPT